MSAEVTQQPPQRRLQTQSAPWKDVKAMEFPLAHTAVPSRCMVRGGTAGAGPQRAKLAKKEKVDDGCRRASRRPTVELRKDRREDDVVQQEQTLLVHRQHVHQSAEALRARRALLCRRSFKSFPDEHSGAEHNSGRASMESHGSKSFLVLTRDEYYNGSLYEVTGPKGSPWRRRHPESDVWGVGFYV